jgi:hypothetical protein
MSCGRIWPSSALRLRKGLRGSRSSTRRHYALLADRYRNVRRFLDWESWDKHWGLVKVDITVGCSIFSGEMYRVPKVRAKRVFSNLFYWNELHRGGLFAAYEHPKVCAREMRAHFAAMR